MTQAIESSSNEMTCRHCVSMPLPHKRLCKCNHSHNDHIYAGGCKLCKCDGYDQRILVEKEPVVREPRVKKTPADTVLDVEELERQLTAGSESLKELTEAQERVDKLKQKVVCINTPLV